MDNKKLIIFGLLFFVAVSIGAASNTVSAASATVYVNSGTGNDAWDGTTSTYTGNNHGPDRTISGGLNDVFSGGTIYVAHGLYFEHITITKSVNIIGTDQSNTIIDGTNSGRVITITGPSLITLSGLTLRNGKINDESGALHIPIGVDVTVNDCTFYKNNAYYGGAIDNYGTLTLNGCTFNENSATYSGGAIYNEGGRTMTISSCKFTNNEAGSGGAIITRTWGKATISGSTFSNNRANSGNGGAIWSASSLTMTNSNLFNNNANNGGALYQYGDSAAIHYCKITGNSFEEICKYSGSNVDATYNWWGSDADPSGKVTDGVLVSPWLKSPKVTTTSPKNKAKKISRTKTIVVTFSSKIKASNAYSKITVRKNGVKISIKKKWINGNKLFIQTKKRSKNKYYTITIPKNAIKNTYGINILNQYTFKFKSK